MSFKGSLKGDMRKNECCIQLFWLLSQIMGLFEGIIELLSTGFGVDTKQV